MQSIGRTKRTLRRAGVSTITVLAATLAALAVPLPASAAGTLLLDESFTGRSVPDPRVVGLDDACLTGALPGSTPPAGSSDLTHCAGRNAGGAPTQGTLPGWLQLTDARTDRTGGMIFNSALPSSAGLQVEFDQAQYGGSGADGIGFFLSDGSYNLTTVGGVGSALGYAPANGKPGVAGGYIGVGLDVLGGSLGARPSGCPATGYTQSVRNIVSLRGPGNGLNGYCLLEATAPKPTGPSSLPGSLSGTTPRNVRVTVSPGTFPVVTVAIDFTGTRTAYQTVLTYAMTDPAPPTYKFGFSASTGAATDVHLVRATTLTTINPLPRLDLVKQIDRTNPQPAAYALGDTIPYQFLLTNSGSEDLTGVTVNDPLVTNVSCPSTVLGPAGTPTGTMTCTASHVVTGTDTQQSQLTNTATAEGTDPGGTTFTATDSVTVPLIPAQARLAMAKNAQLTDTNGNGIADVGEQIQYSFDVHNTGSVDLTDPAVNDPKAGTVDCPATIAAGATVTCTAASPYTVTDADIVAGGVTNTATATADPPNGVTPPLPVTDTIVTPTVAAAAGLALTKNAALSDANGNGLADEGETIQYSFDLHNTGTVTLTGVGIDDPQAGAVTCPSTSLAPTATTTCTADNPYTVTQADILAGGISNTATANATTPAGVPPITPPADTIVTPTPIAGAGLFLSKSATLNDTNGDGLADPGETIQYAFTLRNTGNVTLTGVGVTDPHAGTVTCQNTTLTPGQTTTCTAGTLYTVTEADLLAGGVTNTATGVATPPVNVGLIPPTDTIVTPTPAASTGLALTKTATLDDPNGDGLADLGETIAFGFEITNRGTLTVTDPTVDDPTLGAVTCPLGALAPDAGVTCTADAPRTVTEADILAGAVTNTATADATVPSGAPAIVPPSDTVTVPTALPSAALTLTARGELQDTNGNGLGDAGETIDYTFVVTNTGNVTLDDVTVATNLTSVPRLVDATCPATPLAPGASMTCTSSHVITTQDQAQGNVALEATADGTPPTGVANPLPALAQVSTATAPLPTPPTGGGPAAPGGGTAPSGGELADTGSSGPTLPFVLIAVLAVGTGVVALTWGRRSRDDTA